MSRLIYQGNLNKNFGEFFPTPYIDKVILTDKLVDGYEEGLEMEIQYSLLFTVPEHDPALPNNDKDFVKEIVDRLQFYFIVTKSTKDAALLYDKLATTDTSLPTAMAAPREQHLQKMQEYKDSTGVDFSAAENPVDELSLLMYDSSILIEFLKNPSGTLENTTDNAYNVLDANRGISYDLLHIDRQSIIESLNANNFVTFYSKSGQKILKVQNVMSHNTVVRTPALVPLTSGEKLMYERYPEEYAHLIQYELKKVTNPDINLLAFSSLLTPEQLAESSLKTNSALSLMFGDVAYEKVLSEGDVSSQLEYSYFDNNSEIYSETPLQALDGSYHKADATTHSDIVSKFTQLIDKYAALRPPGREDDDGMNPELSASIDTFSYALQEYKEKIDILPQLKSARNTIMNRSSGTITGAFYNDVGQLLKRADEVVNSGTALTRKLTINAKIIDMREFAIGSYTLPTYTPLSGDLLLKNFNLGRTIQWTNEPSYRQSLEDVLGVDGFAGFSTIGLGEMDDLRAIEGRNTAAGNLEYNFEVNEDGQFIIYVDSILGRQTVVLENEEWNGLLSTNYFAKEEYSISFGYFLYDWESHVINNSFLAQFVDVKRFLKHFGYDLVQRYFIPKKAILQKYMPVTVGDDDPIDKVAATHADDSSPILIYTKNMATSDSPAGTNLTYNPDYRLGTVERRSGPEGQEITLASYPEKITDKVGHLFQHYLTERNMDYLGPQAVSDTNNRMMAFEFQNIDQQATLTDHDKGVIDTYEYEVTVVDNTKMSLVNLIGHYYYLAIALRDYIVDAELECSYNNIDGVFNDFFAESMEARYSANPAGAPYVFCPTVYIKHIDFLTNKYNGDQTQMLLAARDLVQKISPRTGTLEQLKAFYNNFVDLYSNYYSQSSVIGNRLATYGFSVDGDYRFATPMPITQKISHKVTEMTFANQSESSRDAFISTINSERSRYQSASDAYAEAVATAKAQTEEDIKKLFAERSALYEEKIQYEYDRVKYSSGCQYVWWWDAWAGKVDFSAHGQESLQEQDYDVVDEEFSDIDPMGIANFKYGYVWVDPYKEDDVVGWYDVEKYGEPTYFSNYRRDKEKSKGYCRYIKRAYRFRESDFRWDPDEELQAADTEVHTGYGQAHMEYVELDTGRREYGGYAGSPSGAGKLYRERQTELKDRLRYEHAPDEGYEQRLPGFDTIRGYKTYNDWLSDARSGGGGGPRDSAYQGGDQAEVSAYEQFKRGYNTSDTAAQETESEMDAFTEGSTTRESDIGS